jgi:hypothetical protein
MNTYTTGSRSTNLGHSVWFDRASYLDKGFSQCDILVGKSFSSGRTGRLKSKSPVSPFFHLAEQTH